MAMHSGEIAIPDEVVRSLVGAQFPQWRDHDIVEVVTDGTMNAIFRIGDEVAARFPLTGTSASQTRATLQEEADAMAELASACPVPTPRPVAIGEPGEGYPLPWSVQTWVPGEVATASRSRRLAGLRERPGRAHPLATFGRWHAVAAFTGDGRGGDLRDSDEWMALCLRESVGIVDVERARDLWARLVELPPPGPGCHVALRPDHGEPPGCGRPPGRRARWRRIFCRRSRA